MKRIVRDHITCVWPKLYEAMKLVTLRLAAPFLLIFSAHAATNDIESAVLRFPEVSAWKFRPDIAVECANTVIQAGQDSACRQLKQLADRRWQSVQQQEKLNRKICLLCRLVFVNKNSSESLRAPRLGVMRQIANESTDAQAWPYLPFAITNEVPLSLTGGYSWSGAPELPELAENYLAYCVSNGVFRAIPFPVPTTACASNALHQVLSSSSWKVLKWKESGADWSYTLNEDYAKGMLWTQIENMTNKTAW